MLRVGADPSQRTRVPRVAQLQRQSQAETMSTPELKASWAITRHYLAASRFYLPQILPSEDANARRLSMQGFLHHNELRLALDDAMELGELCGGSREFWTERHCAAVIMGLQSQAARLQARL